MDGDQGALRWLHDVALTVDAARIVWRGSEARLAPEFSVMRYMRTDEAGLSFIISDLLDPTGTHGQGDRFVALFIARFWPSAQIDAAHAKVRLEARTDLIPNHLRRIDIVLTFGRDAVLGIENKAWGAPEQDRQVADYLDQLKQMAKSHKLVYLTRYEYETPSEKSIDRVSKDIATESGNLEVIAWTSLVAWLGDCIAQAHSERVRTFLADFKAFIQTDFQIGQDMNEQGVIVDAATMSADAVRHSLKIVAAGSQIRGRLFKLFRDSLKARIASSRTVIPANWHVDESEDLGSPHGGVNVGPSRTARFALRFGFDQGGGNDAYVGIATPEAGGHPGQDEFALLVKSVMPNGGSSADWPWFTKFKPFPNWGKDIEAMALILDDSEEGMASLVASELGKIYLSLRNASLLDHLN